MAHRFPAFWKQEPEPGFLVWFFFFIFVPGMIQYHRLGKWLCWVIGIAVPVGLICACVCLSEIKWVPIC